MPDVKCFDHFMMNNLTVYVNNSNRQDPVILQTVRYTHPVETKTSAQNTAFANSRYVLQSRN